MLLVLTLLQFAALTVHALSDPVDALTVALARAEAPGAGSGNRAAP
jgi:hypothetical protein